ncbi:MAG: putative peptidoglycan glycosyltransferase FtsW, partial [Chlamydiota bacterium]
PILLGFFTFLLVLVFVPGIGMTANGARRWITLFGISMQPSEFVKYTIPLFFIHEVLKYGREMALKDFLRILGKIAIPLVLILIEPDNRTTIMIGGTLVVLFGICSIPKRFWMTPLIIGALGVALFASTVPYVASRLKVYANPELDLKGKGHQPYQAKIALGSGGWTGKGVGQSLQKLSYLPEAQNDYIVAILGEETGFLGIVVLIICYMALTFLGIKIALFTEDKEGSFIAMAMTFLIGLQAFINFGVVSGLLPSTGLNLPLFSQGGSSLIVNFSVIGLILSICPKKSLSQ